MFGEHQDYLHLPVVAAAIPLGCHLVVQPRTDGMWTFTTPRLGFEWSCHIADAQKHNRVRNPGPGDFLNAGLVEALRVGWDVSCGADVTCHVDLPLQAGLSSSSAMVVAWVQSLARIAGIEWSAMELARMANRVEVGHFGEPGGHMDHVASALGGVHRIHPDWRAERLDSPQEGVWVVVDSGEPKDTRGHLTRCKTARQRLVQEHGGSWCDPESLDSWKTLSAEAQALWKATWINAQLEEQAVACWSQSRKVASWMSEHHTQLRDGLGLSTAKLEKLGQAALDAGAWGWKVVGSGGGGCGLAWVPHNRVADVHASVREAGAAASWTVRPSDGATCRPWKNPRTPAVVLAAGRSSRMRNREARVGLRLTPEQETLLQERPKAMLPVGEEGRPFLAVLLERMASEGIDDVCVVLSSEDDSTPDLLKPWMPEDCSVSFAWQTVPAGRQKPEGTADAVQRGLEAHPEWDGLSIAVCNGDNLPPKGALDTLLQLEMGTVAFARSALGLPEERTHAFAVFDVGKSPAIHDLIEKPEARDIERVQDEDGEVWVSMNLFRLPYSALLDGCRSAPLHSTRLERELPSAVLLAAERSGLTLQMLPFHGAFWDLTHPSDWRKLSLGSEE